MNKQLLCVLTLGLAFATNAQINSSIVSAKASRDNINVPALKAPKNSVEKAEGDILYTNDFSTPSDWTVSNGTGHTSGDWTIVNAMPTNLTSQVATYGFPSAMNSASGGNFALVNSDAAGQGEVQNTMIETGDIDVATALANGGSAANAQILLKFTEIYRHYQESYYVEISNDGGANWTQFQVNPPSEVPVNTNSDDPEFESLNISSVLAGGNWSSTVRIRFHYQGTWDWFWGVDDVQLVEAFQNEIKGITFYQSTDQTSTQGLDYYMIPTSQASFPGVTFGATVRNDGSMTQPDLGLNATATGYNQTGATISIAPGVTDSVSVTTPFMIPTAVGSSAIHVTTTMANTDSDPTNNQTDYTISRDAHLYARDNGTATGSIAQVTSQDAAELKIGNLFEIFDNVDFTGVQVRLVNQSAAVGQVFNAEIYFVDQSTGDFTYGGETEQHTITNSDLGTFVTLPILNNDVYTAQTGDVLLVMAHHYGGANEIAFGYAQSTFDATVFGFTADGNSFRLTDPNAIMIRLTDDPSLGVKENELSSSMSVYPNPASDKATVSFDVKNANEATVVVTDLTGKVVSSVEVTPVMGANKVEINTTSMAAGIYTVELHANGSVATKKLVVRK